MYTVLPVASHIYLKSLQFYKSIVGSTASPAQEDEFVEQVVCTVDELEECKPKNLDLGEWKVLVVKQNGKISAIGNKCTHYGAPLVSSAVGDGRIRCQWHGACFSLATGDIEDFPGRLKFHYRHK